ncbi:hypothetical protein HY636_04940 [Candidatus Woesearchaeota archaeon]|nr:hypothetical protein [Candidatus Woesearchaeota archaeon]
MGLEEVKQDIMEEAEKSVSEIISKASKEAEEIAANSEEETHKLDEKSMEEYSKELVSLEKKELAVAKLEAKKYLFDKKKEIMNIAVEAAKKEILNMPKTSKEPLLKGFMSKAEKEFPVACIYCNESEMQIVKKNVKKSVNVLPAKISGGIIAENMDKTLRIDYSYDTLFNDIYEKQLHKLAQILF